MSRTKKAAQRPRVAELDVAAEPGPIPAVSGRVRILRDGVFSEHGRHGAGEVIETGHATVFIGKGLAEPA